MVVSVQYRLGVFGFLYSPTVEPGAEFSGNWGLLDQQVGLQWVSQFGASFGGDTSSIALTCCSAGCKAVLLHTTISSSWPLFNRVVSTGAGIAGDVSAANGEIM